MTRLWRHGLPLLGLLILLALPAGCGKKADPVPPGIEMPRAPQALKLARTSQGIVLNWASSDQLIKIRGFKILRNELQTTGAECPGCPREYGLIKELALSGDPMLRREGERTFAYLDDAVRPGWLYAYRVVTCNLSGFCGEPSEMAELKF